MKTYLRAIMLILKTSKSQFLLIVFLSIFVGVLEGVQVKLNIMIFTAIQDIIVGNRDYLSVIIPFALLTLICPSFYIYTPSDAYFRSLLLHKMKLKFLEAIHKKAHKIEMVNFEEPSTYDYIHKAYENISNKRFMIIIDSIIYIPLILASILSVVFVLGTYNPLLIIIAIISMIPLFVARTISGKNYFKLKSMQIQKNRLKDYLWEVIIGRSTIRDMRVYGTAKYITSKYIDLLDVISEEEWQYEKKKFRIIAILDTIRPIGLGTCILLSSYLVYTGQITVPVFAAIFTILPNIQEYTETLMNSISKTYTNIPFLQNYFDFIDQDEAEEGQEDFTDDIYKIEFRNVSFKYPSSKKYVIKDMNLILNKNESISVLGENGSGKSTFVKLLLGFYRPEVGQIFINEIDLEKIKKRDYWKKVSSVFQDFTKYNLTIRENVGLSQVDSIDDVNLISEHIEICGFSDFIQLLPEGLETKLGKEYGGTDLSGGQWQKVAIARGSFKKSDLITLDEPTAALDPLSEASIFSKFVEMAKNNISVIISHRVGAARLSDRIVIIKSGTIIEDGSHEELMSLDGEYAELYNMQSRWYN